MLCRALPTLVERDHLEPLIFLDLVILLHLLKTLCYQYHLTHTELIFREAPSTHHHRSNHQIHPLIILILSLFFKSLEEEASTLQMLLENPQFDLKLIFSS